ncbi:hypothetical protein BBAD15_g6080 [Beauveria bassiana D1-5]|uniref:Myb-like DNA-binding domain-containing protein n=1 Tax=Beauveria bassiana D1-5 TaxID=1245745 RepID=A0A0A2VQX0_BEABA|nr:hypothetical protein BBAD15_g6080 [Beauveria bassiana D1-5]
MATKSPRIEPQQNVRFLISCIRHSNGGKVDFDAVAKELDIVTRAAAAKRYERLLKSSKDSDKTTNTTAGAAAPSDGDEKPAKPVKPATTKRKVLTLSTPKDSPSKKAKAASRGKKGKVKVEEKEDAEEETKADSESSLSGITSQYCIERYISLANSMNADAPEDLEEPVKAEED